MILLIDNYDSFTYNLYQYLGQLADVTVFRNDQITINKIKKLNPEKIVISPGPGRPEDAGISINVIKNFYKKVSILGVCLGHQCIAAAFHGKIIRASNLLHGKQSKIYLTKENVPIFKDIDSPFVATRYHSLIVDNNSLPENLNILAHTEENEIMSIKHNDFPVYGFQFHPESILTKNGMKLIQNFIEI